MLLLASPSDVELYNELARRLSSAAAGWRSAAPSLTSIADGTGWRGTAAQVARDRAGFVAAQLGRTADELERAATRAHRTAAALTAQLAAARRLEHRCMDDLGRLARLPGDAEHRGLTSLRHSAQLTGETPHAVGRLPGLLEGLL